MNSVLQILSLITNFGLGIITGLVIRWFYKIFKNEPFLLFIILLFINMFDLLAIYIIIIYHFFHGVISLWYLVFFYLGILFIIKKRKRVNIA